MANVVWTPAAQSDLAELAHYIANQDRRPATADRIVDEVVAKCDFQAIQPLSGVASPQLGEGYRRLVFKRWVIVYRPISDGIEVLRIFDSARDYPTLF